MIIRNIWGIGRNYAEHAKELGNDVPSEPIVFLKAGSSASVNSTEVILPWWCEEVHHEVELALKFNSHLRILEGAVCLDLTERSAQSKARKEGLPWTLAKSFDGACAVSAFFTIKNLQEFQNKRIRLWINDELKQDGNTAQMIFKIPQLVDYLMERFPICAGDLILTGTPSGVGPIRDGDVLKAEIEGEITHIWKVKKQIMPEKKQTEDLRS